MRCMKAIKLLSLWGANATKKRFFKKSVISNLKRVINEIVLTFWGFIHLFLASKGVFEFLSSSLVNLACAASMLLVTFFGFRGCLGAFASVSVVLFFSTLLDWFCDEFVEILGSVSPSLRNGLGAFPSVSVVLVFSTLIDWFCDGLVEIFGSVSPSLRNRLGAFPSVSVVLVFSTFLDWFCGDLVEILGSVSPSLRNGLGAFSSVSVVLFFSTLLDWFCDDFVEILGSVSPSLRNGLGAFSSVSVVFFSTLLDWFSDDFVEILGSVSPSLRNGLGAFSTVSAAFCIYMLIDSLHDCNDTGWSGIVRFFALRLGYKLETSLTGTSDFFPFLCVVDATLFFWITKFFFFRSRLFEESFQFLLPCHCYEGLVHLTRYFILSILLFVPGAWGFCLHSAWGKP